MLAAMTRMVDTGISGGIETSSMNASRPGQPALSQCVWHAPSDANGQHKPDNMSSLAAVSIVPLPGCLSMSLRRPSPHPVQSGAMSKRRRIVKWIGVGVCVLIFVVWAVSLWWYASFIGDGWGMLCWSGRILFAIDDRFAGPGWESVESIWRWSGTNWAHQVPRVEWDSHGSCYYIPNWLPFLLVAAPTAFMFYRDRKRIPPGHCKTCGYNLTGAEHERCPECGVACDLKRSRT